VTTDYDVNIDGPASFALGLAAMRERLVREGRAMPVTNDERRQAAEGPRPLTELDCLRREDDGV